MIRLSGAVVGYACVALLISVLLQEVETYFYEALNKWRDLNLTDHFSK